MSITPTNLAKHVITPNSVRKAGYAVWDDDIATWDSSSIFWDSPINVFTDNLAKHTITPTNQDKH